MTPSPPTRFLGEFLSLVKNGMMAPPNAPDHTQPSGEPSGFRYNSLQNLTEKPQNIGEKIKKKKTLEKMKLKRKNPKKKAKTVKSLRMLDKKM